MYTLFIHISYHASSDKKIRQQINVKLTKTVSKPFERIYLDIFLYYLSVLHNEHCQCIRYLCA